MRIVAIRGRNLASLAGDFEIRLDAPPLASAGLFAITGKTGSGKSTTLDALCLALFDRMPRLPAGRGVEVGPAGDAPESRLRNNDVRSVLRRGTGEGYAEVDFRGVDHRRYRARWSVRRARGRAGGRFQGQTMTLRDLDSGEDLSGTKTEVLEATQARLGLTFDQFRRSVLLAQGDFAAFLRADAGERAELLERMTGTDIYGEISRTTHRRAADELRHLELVRQRQGDQRPLDEQARNALEVELAEARRALDEQHRAQQALQQAQRWYQTLDKLAAERDQAAAGLAQAQGEQDAAEPRRRQFERIRALQTLRLPLAARDQATNALAQIRRELERSIAEEHDRQLGAEQAGANAAIAEAASNEAHKAREDVAPAVREARRLDTRLLGAREQVQRATSDWESAQASFQMAKEERDGLQVRSAQAEKTLGQAEDWLAHHAGIGPLAVQWEAWARELDRYTQARRTFDKAHVDIEVAQRAGAELAERRPYREALIAQIGMDRGRAATERAELEEQVAALDPERLAGLREERLSRRGRVGEWRQLVEQARQTRARLEGTRNKVADQQVRQVESDARVRKIEADLGPMAAALVEAEEAHRRLLLASAGEVESLRAQLEEGQPCPVCGAQRHPWAHPGGSTLAGLADEQAVRVALLKGQLEEMSAEKARALAESEQAARRGAELASELDAQRALLDCALETWSAWEVDSLAPADPFAEGLYGRLSEELETLSRALEQIAGDEAKVRALQVRVKAKTGEIEDFDSRLDAERRTLAKVDEQIGASADAKKRAQSDHFRAEESMGQVLDLVAEPLAGIDDWQVRLQTDPNALIDACRNQVDVWRLRVEQRDLAHVARQDLAPRLAQAQARLQGAEEDLARRLGTLEQQSAALVVQERERAALLNGRAADMVEAKLNAAVVQAQREREQSGRVQARAREDLTLAQGAVVTRREALKESEAAAAQAQQDLGQQMAIQGVALDELREALKRDRDWIEEERLALQALRDNRDRSQELLKERERRVEEHRAVERPELSLDSVSEQLPLGAEFVKTAQEHWARLHGLLRDDDRRRTVSREIQAELARQQAAWELWESLRELIGSADGGRFRNFAQSLTLDLLVAHANHHLRDLARRYELQRVPGAEMEIQVIDREMGDEVRSIHSLSGGESFLASLALAMGLASLVSDRVEVESLFIDEGFGALDADSLDLAIASLDALYSLGRQVGVISHVGTLVERIGVKVQVFKEGGGRSRLEVMSD